MWNPSRLTRRAFGLLVTSPLLASLDQDPFTITDNVDLVLLDASVRDQRGNYIINLPKQAFRVSVDGKAQTISQFSRVDAPVTIGLVVDNSGSMRYKRPEVAMAGLAFAKESNPRDEFFVVNFNNTVAAGLPPNIFFTDQIQLLHSALYMGNVSGQTALYDAIAFGLKRLEAGHHDQRTLIVVSDGGDNVSQLHEKDILDLIEKSRATIYTIGLVDPEDSDLKPAILKKFAFLSGGEYFQPAELNDVMAVLSKISKDIRSRYSIGFTPETDNAVKKTHSIKVTASENGRKLVVRTRASYTSDLRNSIQETALRDWR